MVPSKSNQTWAAPASGNVAGLRSGSFEEKACVMRWVGAGGRARPGGQPSGSKGYAAAVLRPLESAMKACRVAYVRYLNTIPLIEGLGKLERMRLIPAIPSRIAAMVRAGEADMG